MGDKVDQGDRVTKVTRVTGDVRSMEVKKEKKEILCEMGKI